MDLKSEGLFNQCHLEGKIYLCRDYQIQDPRTQNPKNVPLPWQPGTHTQLNKIHEPIERADWSVLVEYVILGDLSFVDLTILILE